MFAFAFIILVVILLMLAQFKGDFNRRIHELQEKIDKLTTEAEENQATQTRKDGFVFREQIRDNAVAPGNVTAATDAAISNSAVPGTSNIATPGTITTSAPSLITAFWQNFSFSRENGAVQIGACILIICFGFLIKFSLDQHNYYDMDRLFTTYGAVTGTAALIGAHLLRKKWPVISTILIAIGATILLYVVMMDMIQEDIISSPMALFMTASIIIFLVILALNYDRAAIAVIALVTGTFFLPTAVGHGITPPLLCLLLLHAGMLALAQYRQWFAVTASAFTAVTVILYAWLLNDPVFEYAINIPSLPGHNQDVFLLASPGFWQEPAIRELLFASLFYLLFFVDYLVGHVRGWIPFKWWSVTLFLLNTAAFFINGLLILRLVNGGIFLGIFAVFMALLHAAAAWRLFNHPRMSEKMERLLTGLVLGFVTVAGPLQLQHAYTIVFWAIEAVALYWLFRYTRMRLIKYASVMVLGIMLPGLFAYWIYNYAFTYDSSVFIAGLSAIAAVLTFCYMLGRDTYNTWDIGGQIIARGLELGAVIVIYGVLQLELHYQIKYHWTLMMPITDGILNYLFLAVLLVLVRKQGAPFTWIVLALTAAALLCYPLWLNNAVILVRNRYLLRGTHLNYVLIHYPLLVLFFILLYLSYKIIPAKYLPVFQWICAAAVIYVLSASMDHVAALTGFKHKAPVKAIVHHNQGLGYMLLWSISAAVIMYLGFIRSSKQLRIIALAVFGLMLLKLFFIDLPEMGITGKVVSFIFLGILIIIAGYKGKQLQKLLLA